MPRLTAVRDGAERPARLGRLGRWLARVTPLELRVTDMLEGRWPNRRRVGLQVALVRCWPRRAGAPELEERPERPIAVWRWFGWPAVPVEEMEGDRIVAAARARRDRNAPLVGGGRKHSLEGVRVNDTGSGAGAVLLHEAPGPCTNLRVDSLAFSVGDVLTVLPREEDAGELNEFMLVRAVATWDGAEQDVVVERGFGTSKLFWPAGTMLTAVGRV